MSLDAGSRGLGWAVAIYIGSMVGMAWLRLHAFPDQMVALTLGLPLLLCLWHRDRRLLWVLASSLMALSTWKMFGLYPRYAAESVNIPVQWAMQMANVLVIGVAIYLVLELRARLEKTNAELTRANADLLGREVEIAAQNEELQQQGEELQLHNEELQQQREEIDQQAEELQAHAGELAVVNAELSQRAAMLQALLTAIPEPGDDRAPLEAACRALLSLVGGDAGAAVVLVRDEPGDALQVRAAVGLTDLVGVQVPSGSAFASLVIAEGRAAYVDDLTARPDLVLPREMHRTMRSVLAAPVHVAGRAVGVVEVYAHQPRHWTSEEFRVIAWVAAQCSLLLEVRRLHDELTAANANLEAAVQTRTAELTQLVGELEHFSHTITHDMRAPLRAMHGFATLLLDDRGALPSDRRDDFLERIATAAARLDRLIVDALSYSRSGRHEGLPIGAFEPGPLLRGMLDSYPELQSVRGRIRIEGEFPAVLANEAGLTQCFSNLLTNAIKFVAPGRDPDVRLWAEREGDVVRFWVEDKGIGIPPELHTRIFGLFQRASRDYDGTGLGLALVKKMAERMGGRVGVESLPDEGSRFWLELRSAEGEAR